MRIINPESRPLHWYGKMWFAASMFLIRIVRDTFQPSSMLFLSCKWLGKLITSHDPPIVFGGLNIEYIQKSNLQPGNLPCLSLRDEGMKIVDGKMEIGELQFAVKLNHSWAFADSNSKVHA